MEKCKFSEGIPDNTAVFSFWGKYMYQFFKEIVLCHYEDKTMLKFPKLHVYIIQVWQKQIKTPTFCAVCEGGGLWGLSYIPASSFNRLPGAIPWRPLSEHSHHPSSPLVFCSSTVTMSPLRKDSSSGASALLSYSALASTCCRWEDKNKTN